MVKYFDLKGIEKVESSQNIQEFSAQFETLHAEEKENILQDYLIEIYKKVKKKLESEAIEDFRIDFEDGYGNRSNEEEDQTAMDAAKEVAKGMK